tara:strand:- start:9888 stop:10292 length:405 start_codon:yes stop_codon:yes gene_type:complete
MKITESQIQKVIQKVIKEESPSENDLIDQLRAMLKSWKKYESIGGRRTAQGCINDLVEVLSDYTGEDESVRAEEGVLSIHEQATSDLEISKGFTQTDRKLLNRIYDAVVGGGASGGFKGGRKRALPSLGALPSE